jgi:hypothetical protein
MDPMKKPIRRIAPRRPPLMQLESLEERSLLSATLVDGVLTIDGTDASDDVRICQRGTDLSVTVNGERQAFAIDDVQQLVVNALAGDDRVTIRTRDAIDAIVDGGDGNDVIVGGNGNDQLTGGAGDDQIRGGAGDDAIDGGDGNDRLAGEPGTDTVLGGTGDDTLTDSTGEDSLDGGDGENTVVTESPTHPSFHSGFRRPANRTTLLPSVRRDFLVPSGTLDGWDGPGQGSAQLTYHFGTLTSDIPEESVKSVLEAALAEWAKVVDVVFTETDTAGLANSIDFEFDTGSHGDGDSFDGAGGELAHSFLPLNTSNPLAGDVHFDDAETWEAGDSGTAGAYDLMYVAVHEIGHALGLLHSTDPSAIMFDTVTASAVYGSLAAADLSAIRALYAPAVTTTTVALSSLTSDTETSTDTGTDSGTESEEPSEDVCTSYHRDSDSTETETNTGETEVAASVLPSAFGARFSRGGVASAPGTQSTLVRPEFFGGRGRRVFVSPPSPESGAVSSVIVQPQFTRPAAARSIAQMSGRDPLGGDLF